MISILPGLLESLRLLVDNSVSAIRTFQGDTGTQAAEWWRRPGWISASLFQPHSFPIGSIQAISSNHSGYSGSATGSSQFRGCGVCTYYLRNGFPKAVCN